MRKIVIALALVLAIGVVAGCSCDPCNQCNPCEPCVAAPVYQSPCCPAPSGSVDGAWGNAPAMPAQAPAGY
jgi:hypothetical protein